MHLGHVGPQPHSALSFHARRPPRRFFFVFTHLRDFKSLASDAPPRVPAYPMDIDVSEIKQYIEGTIDFEGQKLATKHINNVLYLGAFLSVANTLLIGNFWVLVGGLSCTYAVSLILSLPWGAYRKNPVTWATST